MTLGEKLRYARKKRGLSVARLASKANVSKCSINMIERGERLNPGIIAMERIANTLNISPLYFFPNNDIEGSHSELLNEFKTMSLDKKITPYFDLFKRAYDHQIPPEIVEELLRTVTKVRNM